MNTIKTLAKKYIITVFILLLVNSCTEKKTTETIALRIGEVEITEDLFGRSLASFRSGREEIDKNELMAWKEQYINKCFLLADAYARQYDTLKSINTVLKHTSNFMMVQKNGMLWEHIVVPLVEEKAELTEERIYKRQKLYYFDFISSNSYNELIGILNNDTILDNSDSYYELKGKLDNYSSFETGNIILQWPFIKFWSDKDMLLNMKPGDVTPLLRTNTKLYYLVLKDVESIKITEEDKKNLQAELYAGFEEDISNENGLEIDRKANPVLIEDGLNKIMDFISLGNDLAKYADTTVLLRYYIEDTLRIIDGRTFAQFYTSLPMSASITKMEDLIGYVNYYYQTEYLCLEAQKHGLFEVDSFISGKLAFKNNLILTKYIENEVDKNISVSNEEINEFYNNNKSNYTQIKSLTIDLYYFNNPSNAYDAVETLIKPLNKNDIDISGLKGFEKTHKELVIDTEENNQLPPELINDILYTEVGSFSNSPVKVGNSYVIFYKSGEEGMRIKKLYEVNEEIEYYLRREKTEVEILKLIEKLKSKYSIEVDNTGIS